MLHSTIDLEVNHVFRTISRLSVVGLLFFASSQTIATATFPNDDAPQSSGSVSKGKTAGCTIEMLSDTKEVDFNPYLRELYVSVKNIGIWLCRDPFYWENKE